MRKFLLIAAALVVSVPTFLPAQSQDVTADYARAVGLADRLRNKVVDVAEDPVWIDGSSRFWYRKSVQGGNVFVLVDPATAVKGPAFDHARLATAINAVTSGSSTAVSLPFTTLTFVNDRQALEFTVTPTGEGSAGGRAAGAGAARGAAPGGGGRGVAAQTRLRCELTTYVCSGIALSANNGGRGAGAGTGQGRGGQGRAGGAAGQNAPGGADDEPAVRTSPDGRTDALIQNFNVFLKPAGARLEEARPLSWDGSEGNAYTFNSLSWSPTSAKIAVYRRRPGYTRLVSSVQSSPSDQLQPKFSQRSYRKPGDEVEFDQPVLFDVVSRRQIVVDRALFPNPYQNLRMEWRRDSRAFTFEYNQRGHQVYRLIEVEAATGRARTVIDETSDTFIDYRRTAAGLSDSGRTYRHDVSDGREVVWMSERDGWSHLYLFDGTNGRLKNQITTGAWAVHHVDRVDEAARQIYFTGNGLERGDPYLLHYYRINFDGTGLTRYTPGDGLHTLTWSPDRKFYVDTYSRVDMAPVSELRRASDQTLVLELERGSLAALVATGWRAPEVFLSKGRDGQTDVSGIIIRPTNFDPSRKYPVVENIYAGPQGSFVPKTFSTQTGMQTLAELGFIVVQIDGMGTANRSKAFHATAWKNLGDAGFPDRIVWHKTVAAKYPYYDITRVGIYGTSAGGQNAMGAVLFHPEFYKAAAASAGCHDNRMDKIWWNEQWMGWPLGPEYAASSNMEHAAKLQGHLLLIFGEMDTNVDPASTMQVVNKLIQANKEFDLLVIPNAGHTGGGTYGDHKRYDFFVRNLQGRVPPPWNATSMTNRGVAGPVGLLDADAMPWVESEEWGRALVGVSQARPLDQR
jgi:dipeptidyl aminopeptidase/acylaminoacyl peptidase